jgi:hypothetical protein
LKDLHIVRCLLNFGRFQAQRLEVLDLCDVVLLIVLGRGTEVAFEGGELLAVQCDLLQGLPIVLVDEIP